jgi:pimeloyl-ACP methyl ester carboxylesterase
MPEPRCSHSPSEPDIPRGFVRAYGAGDLAAGSTHCASTAMPAVLAHPLTRSLREASTVSDRLSVLGGGAGRPLLILLHGLGATAQVWEGWRPLLEERWPGRWLAPDLPGHGGSAPLAQYSFGSLAAAVADLVDTEDRTVVVGHSLGGVVGLALGSGWFGVRVKAVVGVGIKVAWTAAELDRARALAERPVQEFASRADAAARYLRVSGLAGLVDPDGAVVDAGLRQEGGNWRLALDPRAFGVGAPDMPGLLAACRARVRLARGETDPMVSADELAELRPGALTLAGLGHNAHVEDPGAVLRLLEPLAAELR